MARVPDDIPLAAWIRQLIATNKIYVFYKSDEWKRLRLEVLHDAHNECERCLKHGRYTPATIVHHVNEVRKRPDMALTKTYIDKDGNEQKNLVALCFACHEDEHDRLDKVRQEQKKASFTNVERW